MAVKPLVYEVHGALSWDDLRVTYFRITDDPEIDPWGAGPAVKGASVPLEIYFVGTEDELIPAVEDFDFEPFEVLAHDELEVVVDAVKIWGEEVGCIELWVG